MSNEEPAGNENKELNNRMSNTRMNENAVSMNQTGASLTQYPEVAENVKNNVGFINQQANKKSSNFKLAKRSRKTVQPGPADMPMVSEVASFVQYDPKLKYQRIDPWVRNACQKMKSGKFQAGKFVPAIRKYVVDEALAGYGGKETPKNTDAGTKNVIAAYVSKDIMAEAKKLANSGQKCRSYVSPEAQEYMNRIKYYGSA